MSSDSREVNEGEKVQKNLEIAEMVGIEFFLCEACPGLCSSEIANKKDD